MKDALRHVPYSTFRVSGRSMEPTFFENERVLTFNWNRNSVEVGDVVVFENLSGRKLIKRVVRVDREHRKIDVAGDNKDLNAVIYGAIDLEAVVGRVVQKY